VASLIYAPAHGPGVQPVLAGTIVAGRCVLFYTFNSDINSSRLLPVRKVPLSQ